MAEHNITGEEGERVAMEFLIKKGYQILKTNWRRGKAEIDIIASLNNLVVFVEVKCRSSLAFGNPEEFVSNKKERMVIDAADWFMQQQQVGDEARFDIISVVKTSEGFKIEHLEDAFRSSF
jgi:putative endonuclease